MALAGPTAADLQRGAVAAPDAYRTAVRAVSRRLGVPLRRIEARQGRDINSKAPREVVLARRSAIYLSVVAFDASVRSVARAARFTPEGVRKALAAVEDARDDPAFDETLNDLERELQS